MKHVLVIAVLFAQTAFAAVPVFTELPPPPPPPLAAPPLTATFPGGVRIQDFARTVLSDVLKSPFILSAEFLSSDAQVGFSAQKLTPGTAVTLLTDVLADHGFALTKKGDYYRIYPAAATRYEPDVDFVYQARHRDVAYLMAHLGPLLDVSAANSTGRAEAPPSAQKPANAEGSVYATASKGDTSTLLLRAPVSTISRAEKLLAAVDVPAPRVQIRAFVLETRGGASTGYSVSAVAKLLSNKLSLNLGSTATGATAALTFAVPNFDAVASVLNNSTDIRVLTAPSLLAKSGVPATLSVGASVPALGAITSTQNGTQQSVEYLETGVILNVLPRVFADSLELELTQEISDAVATTTGVAASPTISKSAVTTTLTLAPGQVAVVGGLTLTKSGSSNASVPFLPWLRLSATTTDASSDLVIVLHADLL